MDTNDELDRLKAGTCAEVCHYLAMKVRKYRQSKDLSQEEFAREVGIPARTYKRFESHGRAHLDTFVTILRAMERTPYLFMLFPQPPRQAPPTLEDKLRSARVKGLAEALRAEKLQRRP